jgi:hypothetical protein
MPRFGASGQRVSCPTSVFSSWGSGLHGR